MPELSRQPELLKNSPAKSMKAGKLLQKLEAEADLAFKTEREAQNLEVVRRNTKQPLTKAEQSRKTLERLRSHTAEIEMELSLRDKVEVESKRNLEARMKLRAANLTPAERKAQAEEIRRGQIAFSHVVAEAHPGWRTQENPNAEIYRQQYTPTNGLKPKNR
jgi:hypothetical protein